jgi:muconolactone delta-isomerase
VKPRFQKRARSRARERSRSLRLIQLGDARIQWRIAFHTDNPIQYLIDCGELPKDYLSNAFVSFSTLDVRFPITEEDIRVLTEET